MIAAILREAGKDARVGGNIRGISTLEMIPALGADSVLVLELDSWQLQGFRDEKISPDVAVFTTFYPDHLDYYEDMDSYFTDKASIFLHQPKHATLVLGVQAAPIVQAKYSGKTPATTIVASAYEGPLGVPGIHNRENAGCAAAAARALGVSDEAIRNALASFEGVAGRLDLVREVDGVRFYNDTTATTPEATLAALSALDGGNKNVILILGGSDKGLDMNELLRVIPERVKRVIMLPGTGTNRVHEFLTGASIYDTLPAAFHEAVRSAAKGDAILLSPAFASFGMFKNEYDRGDQFNALVRAL